MNEYPFDFQKTCGMIRAVPGGWGETTSDMCSPENWREKLFERERETVPEVTFWDTCAMGANSWQKAECFFVGTRSETRYPSQPGSL